MEVTTAEIPDHTVVYMNTAWAYRCYSLRADLRASMPPHGFKVWLHTFLVLSSLVWRNESHIVVTSQVAATDFMWNSVLQDHNVQLVPMVVQKCDLPIG